jgi:hypothetical protein
MILILPATMSRPVLLSVGAPASHTANTALKEVSVYQQSSRLQINVSLPG